MTTHISDASNINETISRMPTAVGTRGPTLLADAELDHVAAAGGKKGIAPGNLGRCES